MAVGGIHFLVDYETEGLTGLTVGGHSQFLATWAFPTWSERESLSETDLTIFCNVITEGFCYIILYVTDSTHAQEEGTTEEHEKPGDENHKDHLRVCPPHDDVVFRKTV